MARLCKCIFPAQITPQKDFTSNKQSTQKDIQPQKQLKLSPPQQEVQTKTELITTNPPQQQNNGHPITSVQHQQDPNLNISDTDLCSAFYSIQLT